MARPRNGGVHPGVAEFGGLGSPGTRHEAGGSCFAGEVAAFLCCCLGLLEGQEQSPAYLQEKKKKSKIDSFGGDMARIQWGSLLLGCPQGGKTLLVLFALLRARWGSGLGGCSWCIPVVPNRDLRIPPAPSLSPTWDSPSPEPKSLQGKQAGLGAPRIPCRDKSCPLPLQPIRPWDNSTSVSPPAAARTAVPPRPFCPRGGPRCPPSHWEQPG